MQGIEQLRHAAVSQPHGMETIVETLAHLQGDPLSLAALAHEARNMGTALGLYCELLEEPGVLAPGFQHYARELKTVAAASRRLMEKLSLFESCQPSLTHRANLAPRAPDSNRRARPVTRSSATSGPAISGPTISEPATSGPANAGPGTTPLSPEGRWALLPALPIRDLAGELRSNRNLLSALVGPSIQLSMEIHGAALPVRLTGEDLTRVLVNLVKNSVEAMPAGGRMRICLREDEGGPEAERRLELAVEDSGTGIPPALLKTIFEPGFTTRSAGGAGHPEHRGVGLAVTRSIVESAGGEIRATNREPAGAIIRIVLSVPEC